MQQAHIQARRAFVGEQHQRMKEWIGGREVRGLVIIQHCIRHHPVKGWYLESFHYDVPFDLHNRRRLREFRQFAEAFRKGHATPAIGAG